MTVLSIVLCSLIVFMTRLLPRILKPNKTDTDTWYHIASAVSIFKNNYNIPECNNGFILGGKYDYPFLGHWMMAVIFKDKILKYEKYIGPLTDTIYILVGYFYLLYLAENYSLQIDLSVEVKYFLLMALSITMLKISGGPRVYNYTPRIIGELFVFLYFIFLHLYFLDSSYEFFLAASLFGALALNTSTFGSQVMLFVSIGLSMACLSLVPLFLLVLSGMGALILSWGHYTKVISQQLRYTFQYATYGQFNHPAVKDRNRLQQYLYFLKLLRNSDFKTAYTVFTKDLTFANVAYKNLDVLIGIIIIFHSGFVDSFIYSLIMVTFTIFFFFSFRPLLFLGESDRYLDYVVVFSVIVIILNADPPIIYLVLGIELLLYAMTVVIFCLSPDRYGDTFLDAMDHINSSIKEKDKYIIHGILGTYINYPLTVLTGINSLAVEANYVFEVASNKKLMPIDRVYTRDFDYLFNEYGVNLIISNKKLLNGDPGYDFTNYTLLYENAGYQVHVREPSA